MPTPDISPSAVLTEIRACLIAEVMAKPSPEPVTLRRDIAVIIAASIDEVIDRVDALVEGAASADRLARELRIARAENALMEQQLIARDLMNSGKGEIERRVRRFSLPTGGAEVVDLTEALRRERRDAGRPIGPEGGAA